MGNTAGTRTRTVSCANVVLVPVLVVVLVPSSKSAATGANFRTRTSIQTATYWPGVGCTRTP
eukprot:scaffold173865_cov22-Prasinocladus_malaysianus.AAC.1